MSDDNTISYAEYLKKPDNTKELLDDAALRVASGYAYVQPILEDVLQAIFQNGSYPVTLRVGDWSSLPVKPVAYRGDHRVRLNGYEEISWDAKGKVTEAKIWFRNSWGKNWASGKDMTIEEQEKINRGDGYFLWSDYKLAIFEQIVYTDVPMKLILAARDQKYIFTRTLKYKMTGTDVMELQKRLAKEIAKDGQPCFQGNSFTTYFGLVTQTAVQRYQIMNSIVLAGDPDLTGFGQVGPKTRNFLNGIPAPIELFPKVQYIRDQLITIMKAAGHPIIVTNEYRSIADQDKLYAQGRTTPGSVVTNAKGGESMHNYRCAFDIAFSVASGIAYDGPWDMISTIAKVLGLEWGGDWGSFPDKPHFQYTAGYTLNDFKTGKIDQDRFMI